MGAFKKKQKFYRFFNHFRVGEKLQLRGLFMSFIGDMQTTVTGQVESLTRYEIDGDNKGGSIWVSKPNSGKNPNNLGNELIKIKMPFEMFDEQKAKVQSGVLTFPCQMKIVCDVNMGGQNKAVLVAVSMELIPVSSTKNQSSVVSSSVTNSPKV